MMPLFQKVFGPRINIMTMPTDTFEWSDGKRTVSLNKVYEHVLAKIDDSIHWYQTKRAGKRRAAWLLRIGAVVLGIVAAAMPNRPACTDVGQLPTVKRIDIVDFNQADASSSERAADDGGITTRSKSLYEDGFGVADRNAAGVQIEPIADNGRLLCPFPTPAPQGAFPPSHPSGPAIFSAG